MSMKAPTWDLIFKQLKNAESIMLILALSFFFLAGHSYLTKESSPEVQEQVAKAGDSVELLQHGQFEATNFQPLDVKQIEEMTQKLKSIKKKLTERSRKTAQ
ncbi:MAG: hypothetical protein SGI74_13250 [Oligoflexia bacterium]|nr:hypothetical protein [Oligoflexia bacterium]